MTKRLIPSILSLLRVQCERLRYWDWLVYLQVVLNEALFCARYFGYGIKYLFAVEPADMDYGPREVKDPHLYSPAPYLFIRQALEFLKGSLAGRTFVDVGCGPGRVLVCAAEHPFKKVIGVEISPALARLAGENARRFADRRGGRIPPVEIRRENVLDFEFPREDLVVFLYEPFHEHTMKKFADKLRNERSDIFLVYVYPHGASFFREAGFEVVHSRVNRHERGFVVMHRGRV